LLLLAAAAAAGQQPTAGPQPVAGRAGPIPRSPVPSEASTPTGEPATVQPGTGRKPPGPSAGSGASTPTPLSPAAQFAAAKRLVQAKGYAVTETAADWHADFDLNALSG